VFSLEFAPRRACAACAGRDDGGAVVNFVWIRIAAFPPSIVSARGGQCTASSGFHGEHSCLLSHSHVSLAICGGHLAMNRRHPNHLQRAALLPACAEPYLQPPATTPSPPPLHPSVHVQNQTCLSRVQQAALKLLFAVVLASRCAFFFGFQVLHTQSRHLLVAIKFCLPGTNGKDVWVCVWSMVTYQNDILANLGITPHFIR